MHGRVIRPQFDQSSTDVQSARQMEGKTAEERIAADPSSEREAPGWFLQLGAGALWSTIIPSTVKVPQYQMGQRELEQRFSLLWRR